MVYWLIYVQQAKCSEYLLLSLLTGQAQVHPVSLKISQEALHACFHTVLLILFHLEFGANNTLLATCQHGLLSFLCHRKK